MMPFHIPGPTGHPEDQNFVQRASRAVSILYCHAIVTGEPLDDDPDQHAETMRQMRDVLLIDLPGALKADRPTSA